MKKENLEALWDTITPKLYGYLINTLHDRGVADDILQTTWVKAIEALPRFRERGLGSSSFSSWLFAIAKNECRQHWRGNHRDFSFDPDLHDTKETDSKDEDEILINQLLSQLSNDDRELVRLRYIADLPLDDVARILKINPITARVRMHRALKVLKTLLTD